jgi:hypothetical protein
LSRLLIDLSWASSKLEGNTYSRLDTQNLIELGQVAEDKDRREAQMILNHKAAIELLVEQAEDIRVPGVAADAERRPSLSAVPSAATFHRNRQTHPMTCYDIFNGDADGLCALIQLRLQQPVDAVHVTGVKRDIQLLDRVRAKAGDKITVLDISLDSNRVDLQHLLNAGAVINYFDHHFADPIPNHPGLIAHIHTTPNVCTSLLMDKHLGGTQHLWAITGAFGDNLHQPAEQLAASMGLTESKWKQLKELGEALNYNAYGETAADLRYAPEELFRLLFAAADPFVFIRESQHFQILREGLTDDIKLARRVVLTSQNEYGTIYLLPDADWARRVSGIFANELAVAHPARAHAILTHHTNDSRLTVSVRAPKANPVGADQLCRQFATGGGRKAAAGINNLPESDLANFATAFDRQFGSNG